jgi:hypothetical protein
VEENLYPNSQTKEAPRIISPVSFAVLRATNMQERQDLPKLKIEPLPKNLVPVSLERNFIETIPEKQVIFDGLLYKYKPTVSTQSRKHRSLFMSRWC